MTGKSRAERAAALEQWAHNVNPEDLTTVDTESLRVIAELAERRDAIDDELPEAVRAARRSNRSWSEIGAMLGVSKQAAQRKYVGWGLACLRRGSCASTARPQRIDQSP